MIETLKDYLSKLEVLWVRYITFSSKLNNTKLQFHLLGNKSEATSAEASIQPGRVVSPLYCMGLFVHCNDKMHYFLIVENLK